MFPWLPFLSFDANSRRRGPRRNRKRGVRPRSSLDSVWLRVECGDSIDGAGVQVEYPRLPFRPLTATETIGSSSSEINIASPATTNTDRPDSAPIGDVAPPPVQSTAKRKARITVPQPETTGSRSPRSASNSRPSSSAAKQPPTASPQIPVQRPSNARARMFETSSAMLDIFGGAPPPVRPVANTTTKVGSQVTSTTTSSTLDAAFASTAVYEGAVACTSTASDASNSTNAKNKQSTVENQSETAAVPCFERIPSPPPVSSAMNRPNFGRTNALLREGVLRTEWEPITSSTTATASSFHTVPDHDLTYTNARHRGNWESGVSSFNVVNQQIRRDYTPPRANGTTAECPADIILRQRSEIATNGQPNGQIECPLERPEIAASSNLQLNGTTASNRRARVQREGVAEIFSVCAQRPADAAGETSSGSGAYKFEKENKRTESNDRRSPSPSASRQSPQNDENREPVGFSAKDNQVDSQPLQLNGRPQLNGTSASKPKDSVETRLRRLLWSTAEDGSGMTAATSNGNGGSGSDARPLIIRGAQIVNDDAIFAADVLVVDGVIRQILPGLDVPENAEQIDAAGRWLLPAGIDVHVEVPNGGEELKNTTNSAISGGTTTLVNVVTVNSSESLTAAVERSRLQIERFATCSVALSVPLTSWSETTRSEVERLISEYGITSFLLELRNDSELFEALSTLKKLGALPCALPENRDLVTLLERQFSSLSTNEAYCQARPAHLESDTVNRLSTVAQLTNAPLGLVSVGSSESCRAVQVGRQRGAMVYAQIPIAAVTPDSRSSNAPQSRIPIRGNVDDVRDAIELLANGPFSVCTSDHTTIRSSSNRLQIGSITVAERLALLWEKAVATGRLDLMRFVAVTSANPAKLLGIYPRKVTEMFLLGRIAVGADADLVIWNAKATRTFGSSRSNGTDKSTFDGTTVHVVPELTLCAGRIVYRNGSLTDDKIPTENRWLPLKPNAPHVFSLIQLRDRTIDLGKPNDIVTSVPTTRKDSATSNGSGGNERPQSRDHVTQPPTVPSRSTTKVIQPPGGRSNVWF
ncbi:Amidohydrolase 1 domain containing protein [Aphelenchoides besseyi]|nr:Amidohydrolase 1 domain containing protein [Aphelenchoides besseyi]